MGKMGYKLWVMERKKLCLLFLFSFLISHFLFLQAQEAEVDYQARFTELHSAFARDPHDEETLYRLTLFFFDNSNPMRNLPMALDYAGLTEECHADMLNRNRVRDLVQLQKKGITLTSIRELKQAIRAAALESARIRNDFSMAEIDNYLAHFGTDAELVKLLRGKRYRLVYETLLRRVTNGAAGTQAVADCYAFMQTYPGTAEAEQLGDCISRMAAKAIGEANTEAAVDSVVESYPPLPAVRRAADRRKGSLAFHTAEANGSIAAYRAFLVRYPASDESEEARDRIDRLMELDLAKRTTAIELAHFADSNADLDLADQALARLRHLIYSRRDVQAAQYYVDHFKFDDYYNEVYSRYYSWYSVEGNGAPLRHFADANPDFPYPHALEDDLERSYEIDAVPLLDDYVETDYDKYAGYIRHMMGKAIAIVPLQRMMQPLLAEGRYDDALYRTEQFELCFDNQYQHQYDELRRLISTPSENVASRSIRNNQSIQSNLNNDTCMLPDGSGMIVASDRAGGFNLQASGEFFHGDTALASDLWYVPFVAGRWGTPVNLGPKVNTPYCERYPVISRNLKTLYFVSDGHDGLGFGDIYVVERSDLSDWTSWGKPRNLGRDVNSPFREADLSLSADERTLYFTSRGVAYSVATTHDTTSAPASIYSLFANSGSQASNSELFIASSGFVYAFSLEELISMDRPVMMPVVQFSHDGTELLPEAQLQLEQLSNFVAAHPRGVVEMLVGVPGLDARQCYDLSIRRSEALRDFLSQRGVAASRILLSPMGNQFDGVAVRFRE